MIIKSTVRTWGNSLAVRIPKIVSEDLGIEDNSAVTITVDDGLLVITPISGCKKRLQRMLRQITRENLPNLRPPFGRRVGREAL